MSTLEHAWWTYWRQKGYAPLGEFLSTVFIECWTKQLGQLRRDRGLTWQAINEALDWQRHILERARNGTFLEDGGTPALYFYTLAPVLNCPVSDLLPEARELLIYATTRLFARFQVASVTRRDCVAYVEYHFQSPQQSFGLVDELAAQRALENLQDLFANRAEVAQSIKKTAEALHPLLPRFKERSP